MGSIRTYLNLRRGGQWCFDSLYTQLADEIKTEIGMVAVPLQLEGPYQILWKGENDGCYSTSSAYNLLTEYNLIWKCKAPEKVCFFLWLAAREALSTNQRRHHCHLATSASCTRCGTQVEDAEHILRHCAIAVQVWGYFRALLPRIPSMLSFREWLVAHLQHEDYSLSCAIMWNLWVWRNNVAFEPHPWPFEVVLRKIQIVVTKFLRWGRMSYVKKATTQEHEVREEGTVELCTDGSMIPALNVIGRGGVLRDKDGRWITGFAASWGCGGDTFTREIQALCASLCHVWDLGFRKVLCFSDCANIVELVMGTREVDSYWQRDAIQQVRK